MILLSALTLFATYAAQTPMTLKVHAKPGIEQSTINEVVATIEGTQKAWNSHDIDQFSSYMTDDCQWVNVVGMFWDGKPSVKKAHLAFHKTMFKDVDIYYDEMVLRQIAPHVVVAVVTGGIGGYTTPGGHINPPSKNRMMCVLVERDHRYLISSAENVPIDEMAARFDPGK